MDLLHRILFYPIQHNGVLVWLVALLAGLATIPILKLLQRLGVAALTRLAHGKHERFLRLLAGLLGQTHTLLIYVFAVNVAVFLLVGLPDRWHDLCPRALGVALLIQMGIWLNALIEFYIENIRKLKLESDPATVTTIMALGFIGKLACFLIVFMLGWQFVFNSQPTALLTSLGVGGIAVGLAAQHVLGDLFASISIVLDKPFVIGDFIIVGDFMGTIEHVGLKSTRVRSLSGEQLVFSNQDLLNSRIRNYKRMFERRIVFKVSVTYETPVEKVRNIAGAIRDIVQSQPRTRFDRAHFSAFGDSSLIFETAYYVLDPDYNVYMNIQQAINLTLMEHFQKEGIEFAYPTQRLLYEHAAGGPIVAAPTPMPPSEQA